MNNGNVKSLGDEIRAIAMSVATGDLQSLFAG